MISRRFRLAALARATVFLVVASTPLRAQVRADPGTVINGRVAVRVYVTLSDEETAYAPMGGVSLRFFRTTADTVVTVKTDDAGATTALLVPGEYRLMSTSPVDWKGARYSWSRLVQVRAGIPTIELTAGTAERDANAAVHPTPMPMPDGVAGSVNGGVDTSMPRKDPSVATMYSFFLPGSGHLYAGEHAKGGALMALSLAGGAIAASQLSCASAADCRSTTGGMTLGAAGMVAFFGSWLFSVLDAGDAARRFNAQHGVVAAGVQPVVMPGARGDRVRLGLSFAVR